MAVGSLEIALKVQTREATKQLNSIGDAMLRAGKKSKDTSAQFKSLQDILNRLPGSNIIRFFKNVSTNASKARQESLKLSAQIAKLQAQLKAGTSQRPFISPQRIKSLNAQIANLNQKFAQTSSTLKNFYGPIAFTALANAIDLASRALRTFIGVMSKALAAAIEQDQANRKLEAVLLATGEAAGYSYEQLDQLAEEIQRTSTFADKAAKEGMARLATFTNITGNEFVRATHLAKDLSSLMGSSFNQAALQLGRALNDVKGGLDLLTQSGIAFTKEQKELLFWMEEVGRQGEAQRAMLTELEARFGGVATAIAKGPIGALRQLQQQLIDTQEAAGELAADGIRPVVDELKGFLEGLETGIEKIKEMREETGRLNAEPNFRGQARGQVLGENLGTAIEFAKHETAYGKIAGHINDAYTSYLNWWSGGAVDQAEKALRTQAELTEQLRESNEAVNKEISEQEVAQAKLDMAAARRAEHWGKERAAAVEATKALWERADAIKDELDVTRELRRQLEDMQKMREKGALTQKQFLDYINKQIKEIEDIDKKNKERERQPQRRDTTIRGFDSALEGAMAMNRRILTAAASREDVTIKAAEETARNTKELSETQKTTLEFWKSNLPKKEEWKSFADRGLL